MEEKIMYYYNEDYPESGIDSFKVVDEIYEIDGRGRKDLVGVNTFYDMESYMYSKIEKSLHFYGYNGLYSYDNRFGNTITMCYDEEKLKGYWLSAAKRNLDRFSRKVERLKGVILDVEGHN